MRSESHSPGLRGAETKPPAFFLAGDSTTAPQSTSGGGWGDGFLNHALKNGAFGINFAINGSTTVSFVDEGHWAKVMDAIRQYKDDYHPFVTIQFGHNDQKPKAGISIPQFVTNLVRLAAEASNAGATPIIVTSLTRRTFQLSSLPPCVERSLLDVVVGAKVAAETGHYYLLDLNQASTDYCSSIGPVAANMYNLYPEDATHVNEEGSVLFGAMVAELLRFAVPWLWQYVIPDHEVVRAIREGFIYPSDVAARDFQDGITSS